MAQRVFEYDGARVPEAPLGLSQLKDWILAHPGRFTYPQPPDYLGLTFLTQVLYGVLPHPSILQNPVPSDVDLSPLWDFLDVIHPALWRKARAFPANDAALGQLLADAETDISFAFNPGRASAEIAAGNLAETVRTFVLKGGMIRNASFVAISFNASHKAGAQVVANLILDPDVQAHVTAAIYLPLLIPQITLMPDLSALFLRLGTGKSTVLAAIAGALDPVFRASGRVTLNGRDVTGLPTHARHIGLLFQDAMLFPHLSVGQNLGFALPPGPNRRDRIDAALDEVGPEGFATRDPATLSGGQAARVALMRSLLAQPQALLLDGPFTKLDTALRQQIRDLVF